MILRNSSILLVLIWVLCGLRAPLANGSKLPMQITGYQVVELFAPHTKKIKVLKILLSKAGKRAVLARLAGEPVAERRLFTAYAQQVLPRSVQLGMNEVPVLDQGTHGSCVTFAVTAAIDAYYSLAGNSAISQLCNLALSKYLEQPKLTGDWEASYAVTVFKQIAQHGYLNRYYQQEFGCGGLNDYPVCHRNMPACQDGTGDPMFSGIFDKNAELVSYGSKQFGMHDWHKISYKNFLSSPLAIKSAIVSGKRVVVPFLLSKKVFAVGAAAEYKNVLRDTWVDYPVISNLLGQDIHSAEVLVHEVILTGYDDDACAAWRDADGTMRQQCGLFTLRNSWGESSGDHGNYYMSYDYFEKFGLDYAYTVGKW